MRSDAQWFLENKDTLSLKKFVKQYSLTDRHYASSRYRTIVTKCLINDQKRLLLEYNTWKQSEDSTRFWTIIRRKTQLDAHAGVVDYVGDIVNEEVGQLCKDKDHTRVVADTTVNEMKIYYYCVLKLLKKQAKNRHQLLLLLMEMKIILILLLLKMKKLKLNHKLLQSLIPTKIYHVLKLHKMEISTNYLTFTKLKQPNYQMLDL